MIQMYDLMKELMPFFMLPIAIIVLSNISRIVKNLMRVECKREAAKELMKENDRLIKEEKAK